MPIQRVLFVCLGNICRSPLGEGILRREAEARGLRLEIDSAGTGSWHVGQLADRRSRQVGQAHGCRMDMRARQVRASDFDEFDLIVAMDRTVLKDLHDWPNANPMKVRLARSFDPSADSQDVPDPYYGDLADFEEVAEMLERACDGILLSIKKADN